jgi:DNA/RNA-binding domain of Phe-tRNA-synthetase-like protein
MANRPEKRDVDFSWEGFRRAANSDLVGNLGNLAYRIVTFLKKHFGTIPEESARAEDRSALAKATAYVERISALYDAFRIREAVAALLDFGDHGNLYFHRSEPWVLIKGDRQRCAEVMHTAARILAQLTWPMAPIMPRAAAHIRGQLDLEASDGPWEIDPPLAGREVQKPQTVFAKVEADEIAELAVRFRGQASESTLPPLSYTIDPAIDYHSYVVELSGLQVKRHDAELEHLKRSRLAELDLAALASSPRLAAYRPLLEERDRGGRTVSVDNLIAIVRRAGKLPTINVLVDAYNLLSLQHTVVMGAYDRRALTGNLRMKVAEGQEHFVPVAGKEPEKILPGEWVITDEEDRVVTKILTKQSEAVAVTTDTTDAAMCIQGNPAIGTEELRCVTIETCELVQRVCGGQWRIVNE